MLLPEEPNMELESAWPSEEPETKQLYRMYHFDFLPLGFFSILMSRLLHSGWHLIIGWRNGMLLTKRKERFLIKLLPDKCYLDVRVRGPQVQHHLEVLVASIDTLILDWLHVRTDVYVPCIHCLRSGSTTPYLFPMVDLERAMAVGETVVKCRYVEPVSIYELAPDITLENLDSSKINYSDLRLIEEIGEGADSKVFKAYYHGKIVAVKKMRISREDSVFEQKELVSLFQEFRREVWIMAGLRHPNILPLVGICMDPLCVVMPYMGLGSLYDFIHSGNRISWPTRLKIAYDVAKGMAFLHSITPPIIHRDLKSPNVLLERSQHKTYYIHGHRLPTPRDAVETPPLKHESVSSFRTPPKMLGYDTLRRIGPPPSPLPPQPPLQELFHSTEQARVGSETNQGRDGRTDGHSNCEKETELSVADDDDEDDEYDETTEDITPRSDLLVCLALLFPLIIWSSA